MWTEQLAKLDHALSGQRSSNFSSSNNIITNSRTFSNGDDFGYLNTDEVDDEATLTDDTDTEMIKETNSDDVFSHSGASASASR